MLLLIYVDLKLQWFYISLIKFVLASCHLKNYFVITYLLEDEQELSLGMLIRLKRIYNFLCFMLVFYLMPYVFYMFSFFFRTFSWTNLLTRCLVPVSSCLFLVSEKLSVNEDSITTWGKWQAKDSNGHLITWSDYEEAGEEVTSSRRRPRPASNENLSD